MKPATETPQDGADRAGLIARHWLAQGTPFIAAKTAATLDGRSATRSGDSQWITGEAARADVMQWRRLFPAIAVGAGTVLADNPRLTARIPDHADGCPIRFVFDSRLRTATEPDLPQVYTDEFRARTIVVTTLPAENAAGRRLLDQGVKLWTFPAASPRVPIAAFRRRCAEEGITGIYVEGGPDLLSQFLGERQLDYLFVYRGPLCFADSAAKPVFSGLQTYKIADAIRLTDIRHEAFGDDLLTRGRIAYPERLVRDETPATPESLLSAHR